MDREQTDHCRAYGLVYRTLAAKVEGVAWLLNYRGGSFLLPADPALEKNAAECGVRCEKISQPELDAILSLVEEENMDVVPLEIAPRIGLYLPASEHSDIVGETLRYAGIPYQTVYDAEILQGKLTKFDWLHIHHKDFTGQGHKSRADHLESVIASQNGFKKVWQMKQAVSDRIRQFIEGGGFLFAMCSAAETIDISLAGQGIDYVPSLLDGDPADPDTNAKLDYGRSLAFTGFQVLTSSLSDYSDIDVPEAGDGTFQLFEFSAKVDPIPCLLNQDHVNVIPGFSGETTSFRKTLVKKSVTILAENNDGVSVRYLCGTHGKGIFCFCGGHCPDGGDQEFVRYAPAYRLILNNVLFPSAKIKKRKT
jgi:hypothetical protein